MKTVFILILLMFSAYFALQYLERGQRIQAIEQRAAEQMDKGRDKELLEYVVFGELQE